MNFLMLIIQLINKKYILFIYFGNFWKIEL